MPNQRSAAPGTKPFPQFPGYTLDEALTRLENNAVNAPQAFYIMGGDLVRQVPNSKRTLSILQKAKFIVVQGAFMTEVAKLADVVLPVNIHAEVSGTYTNTDGKLGQLKAAVSANGCRPGWQIISALSRKLDSPLEYYSAEDIFKEMTSNMPVYAGIKNGYRWPCPSITAAIAGKICSLSIPRLTFQEKGNLPLSSARPWDTPAVIPLGRKVP